MIRCQDMDRKPLNTFEISKQNKSEQKCEKFKILPKKILDSALAQKERIKKLIKNKFLKINFAAV